MKKHFGAGLFVLALLLASALACGQGRDSGGQDTGTGTGTGAGTGTAPLVSLLSPPNGTQIAVGNQVYLQARAFAREGVGRVEFAVDGSGVGTQSPASAQRLFTAAVAWTPPAAGTYTLSATTYDKSGQASAPAQVTVTVKESFGQVAGQQSEGQAEAGQAGGGQSEGGQAGGGQSEGGQAGGGQAGGGQPEGGQAEGQSAGGQEEGGQQEGELSEQDAGVSVDFRADRTQVASGESTILRWDVEGVREIYLDGEGVTGHGSREVWPFPPSQIYILHVVLLSGEARDYTVTITVSGEYTLVSGPDLVVLGVDCPDSREPDESVPVQVEVLNAGDQPAHAARWRWTIAAAGADPGPWTPGDRFNLEPGATILLRADAPPQAAGQYVVHADVQLDGEGNTTNNSGSDSLSVAGAQVSGPDLAILSVACSGFDGQGPGVCEFRCENRGDADYAEAGFSWNIAPQGQVAGEFWQTGHSFGGIAPGQGAGVDIFDLPTLAPGNWTMHVRIILDGDVDQGNNYGTGDFTVAGSDGGGQGAVPASPANLRRAAIGLVGSVTLEWDHDSANVETFRVRQVGSGWAAETGPGETSAAVSAPPCGETWRFRVLACNAAGCSEPSNTLDVEGTCP